MLKEEKVRLESESAASLAALRDDMEKRDAAHEARIDRLRQFALKEKARMIFQMNVVIIVRGNDNDDGWL